MKNKRLFLKIYIPILILYFIFILITHMLSVKYGAMTGYIDEFYLDIERTSYANNIDNDIKNIENKNEYILTNKNITNYIYNFRLNFYDKIFRKSDIYDANILSNSLPNYIISIRMYPLWERTGIIESKIPIKEKIDNIKYTVELRGIYLISIIPLLSILLIYIFKDKIQILINKIKNSQIYNKNINFRIDIFIILGYLYLILPYMIFVCTWTKYYISIPITLILLTVLFILIKESIKNYNKVYTINLFILITIIFFIILFVVVSGVGELFPQSFDMRNGRNATIRDLINFSWPIIYPKNGFGFVYYFAHWVIPSLFGKLLGLNIGIFSLVIWTSFGIFIFYILALNIINVKEDKYKIIFLIMFMLFSTAISNKRGNYIFIEYMSMMRQVYHLFNQSIGIWVMCILFLYQKNSSNFAFLGLSVVFYSPYAIIGIIPYMIVKVILDIKNNKLVELKNILSISNILSSISIFPLLYLYLSSSSTTNDGFKFLFTEHNYLMLFINSMLCFGVYMILLYNNNKNNYIFYTSIFVFLFVSMIQYSSDHNFSRTNLTAIFFTFMMSIKYLNDNINIKSIKKSLFIILIIASSFNSFVYFEDQIYGFAKNRVGKETDLYRTTFNTVHNQWVLKTMTCQDIENSIFFKYIAKDNKK